MFSFKVTRLSKEDTFSQRKEYIMSEVRNIPCIYRAHFNYRFHWIKTSVHVEENLLSPKMKSEKVFQLQPTQAH